MFSKNAKNEKLKKKAKNMKNNQSNNRRKYHMNLIKKNNYRQYERLHIKRLFHLERYYE